MSNLFLKTFKITNNSIILTIPLIIGVKMLDLYSVFTKYTVDSLPKFFLASLTMLFMFGVLSAAWFYIVKEAVNLSKKVFVFDKDRANATFSLFKLLPEGIGKFFLRFCNDIRITAVPVSYAFRYARKRSRRNFRFYGNLVIRFSFQ